MKTKFANTKSLRGERKRKEGCDVLVYVIQTGLNRPAPVPTEVPVPASEVIHGGTTKGTRLPVMLLFDEVFSQQLTSQNDVGVKNDNILKKERV
jgi:hypothetical protein